MAKTFTVQDFFKRFPDDDSCLDHLMKVRFGSELTCPKCGKHGKFSKLSKLPAYSCACGHHIHPMVGTPFENSHTPLQKWFYAMYLFTTSRHGVPAKELQRQLSVTYKTAWRIGHEIRKYLGKVDGDNNLGGHVEIDETYVGGKRAGKRGRGASNKTIVFGMLERGSNVMTQVVPNVRKSTLQPIITKKVIKNSEISTDELKSYSGLSSHGFDHGTVSYGVGQYVSGTRHVNGLEGFWSQLKRAILGIHVHVSAKHMSKYLGEFEYRYNMRKQPEFMFQRLLLSF
ncbi:transposase-like protein [Nitrosomonas oligotropha]|uniref:Transposase-like protein n=1 Tax=Nitrosomonas oligotropha TaxID=42354 RepID=A0A2T5I3G7_9PROT|nr:IS1595 family transposase [Nitrosomonas oligotropha]PTQ78369.1 transposase-like protein [Nitrosomonas oligotropha]